MRKEKEFEKRCAYVYKKKIEDKSNISKNNYYCVIKWSYDLKSFV